MFLFPDIEFFEICNVLSLNYPIDNSDLNLKIDPMNLCSAQAMSEKGFAHLWAGNISKCK